MTAKPIDKLRKKPKLASTSISKVLINGKGKAKAPVVAGSTINAASTIKRKEGSSDDDGSSEDEDDDDRTTMLAILEARGRAMFGFDMPQQGESSAAGAQSGSDDSQGEDGEGEEFQSDDGWGAEDGFVSDSEEEEELQVMVKPAITKTKIPASRVPEVLFAPSISGNANASLSKAERKAFLNGSSSKMMGIDTTDPYSTSTSLRLSKLNRNTSTSEAEAEDSTNRALDKSLHEMLLTSLLPTHASETASRPVDKRNAIHGRLMELAEYSKPGEGTKSIKEAESRHHPVHVRTGILKAQARREERKRAEDEAAGSWVRGAGGLGDLGKKRSSGEKRRDDRLAVGTEKRKRGMDSSTGPSRDRGLRIGIGKFENGMLKLSEREIARGSAQKQDRGGPKRKKGRR